MAKAQQYQRSELPPGQVGIAKPPYELADRSGQIGFGRTMAGTGLEIANMLVEANAVNEQHEFIGRVDKELVDFESFVKNNPGVPFEEYTRERDKVLLNIKKAGETARTGIAKRWIRNWYAQNTLSTPQMPGGLLQAKFDASRDAVIAEREQERFNIQLKIYRETGNVEGVTSLITGQKGKLLGEEQADALLEFEMGRTLYNQWFNIALSDPQAVLDAIDNNKLPKELIDDPGYKQALRHDAEGALNYNKRRGLEMESEAILKIHKKAAAGVSPEEIKRFILESEETKILSGSQKTLLMEEAMKSYKIWDVEGERKSDVREEARLKKMALDISTGAVKRERLLKEVTESAYGEKPTIDAAAYDSIMDMANREHKSYQANAMGEAINYGLRQLTHTDEEIDKITESFLTMGLDDDDYKEVLRRISSIKRLQGENFSQYTRAMNEWFQAEKAAGRDPDDDDIYIKSRQLMQHYRKRELTEAIYEDISPKENDLKISMLQLLHGTFKIEKVKSPYPEWPDAFLEAGVWKVIREGKKYRIEE